MMNDRDLSYRWQDHVITPKRAALNLLATALIVAIVSAAGLQAGRDPDPSPAANVAATTERTPSLAHLAKRHVSTHSGLAAPKGC